LVNLALVSQNEIQHTVGGRTKCTYFIQSQNFDLTKADFRIPASLLGKLQRWL